MSVSRPIAILIWFLVSVLVSLGCGMVAAFLGEPLLNTFAWGGGGFIGFGTLALGVLAYLSGGVGPGDPPTR